MCDLSEGNKMNKLMDLRPVGTTPMSFKEQIFAPWYFKSWFEKLLVFLGTLSIFYSIARIIAQGIW